MAAVSAGERARCFGLLIILVGCHSGGNAPAGAPDGGAQDGPASRPDAPPGADAAGGSSALACHIEDFACSCNDGDVGNASSCSAVSVAADAGGAGVCCRGPGAACHCAAFTCIYRLADSYCYCVGGDVLMGQQGTRAADCSAVLKDNPDVTCCLDPVGCTCGPNPCAFTAQKVDSCDTQMLGQRWCDGRSSAASCP